MFSATVLLLITHRSSDGADPKPQEVRVEADEFRFAIDRPMLEAGRPIALTIINKGKMKHEFVSDLFAGADTEMESDGIIVEGKGIEEIELAPGKRVKVTFIPQKKGKINFICDIPGHREQGMMGAVSIR